MEESTETAVIMRVRAPATPLVAETTSLTSVPSGHVRIRVAACGVCRADVGTAAAPEATSDRPVTPGHEIAGTIAAIGPGVERWTEGDRVAVGWYGGSCGQCSFCRVGDPVHCPSRKTPGLAYPGGWAQTVTVPADALVAIPEGMDFFDAAPMGCAGVTTFTAIERAGLAPGATVAVFGIGGLGHLAVQFASRMGYRTIAIARGEDRAPRVRALGAQHYIDSAAGSAGGSLATYGGADLILVTAPATDAVPDLIDGLAVGGRLVLIGVDGRDVTVPATHLIMKGQILTGHLTGSAADTERTLRFAADHGIRPVVERLPLTAANEAVTRIATGSPRFRIVLDTNDIR